MRRLASSALNTIKAIWRGVRRAFWLRYGALGMAFGSWSMANRAKARLKELEKD